MGLNSELHTLVEELDRIHAGAFPWIEVVGIPDFVTAENGMQRYFTRKAREALRQFAETLYATRLPSTSKIELKNYEKIVRQAVSDLHARDDFHDSCEDEQNAVLAKLTSLINERLAGLTQEYTHYFPAWTLGMEATSPFSFGPVTFLSRADWIDSVDFHHKAKDNYLNQPDANFRWRKILKEALQHPRDNAPLDGLAGTVYAAISKCPSLLKVTIIGYERDLSRKLAKLVCKTALDAVSLGFGAPEHFHQQALYEERLPPVDSNSLIETNGFLWLPGSSLGKRIPTLAGHRVNQALVDMEHILPAFASILQGLVNPSAHKHPKLANRWATALDWFGEGSRETSDAIALAKLGTCLDVLACGGKNVGIREMVIHITGTSGDTQVIQGRTPRTLAQLVKDIYDHGRSKILHGTHYDRLESFALERQHAAYLARVLLIMCALRLQSYSGPDDDKAFRTMPAQGEQ